MLCLVDGVSCNDHKTIVYTYRLGVNLSVKIYLKSFHTYVLTGGWNQCTLET